METKKSWKWWGKQTFPSLYDGLWLVDETAHRMSITACLFWGLSSGCPLRSNYRVWLPRNKFPFWSDLGHYVIIHCKVCEVLYWPLSCISGLARAKRSTEPGPPKELRDFGGITYSSGVFGRMWFSPSGLKEGMVTQNSGQESPKRQKCWWEETLLCVLIYQRGLGILKRSKKLS